MTHAGHPGCPWRGRFPGAISMAGLARHDRWRAWMQREENIMNLEQAKSLDAKALHKAAGKLKPETRHFIDGKFVSSKKGRTFQTINPATGDVIAEVARGDASDVDAAVK